MTRHLSVHDLGSRRGLFRLLFNTSDGCARKYATASSGAVLNYFIRLAVFGNTIQHDDKSPGSAHLENAVSVTRLFHLENDLKSYADSTTSF